MFVALDGRTEQWGGFCPTTGQKCLISKKLLLYIVNTRVPIRLRELRIVIVEEFKEIRKNRNVWFSALFAYPYGVTV